MSDLAREAEWLVKDETEKAVARREGYVLSPHFFRLAPVETTVGLVMASLLGLATANVVLSHGFGVDMAFLAVAGLSLGLIPLARHWEKRQEAARECDREMRESFGRGGRFVSMIVLQGDAPTGEDRGMLWFEDGRLYFSGHRTSFGLVPDQVRGSTVMKNAVPRVRNEVNLILNRQGATGWCAVSFGVPVLPGAFTYYARRELAHDVNVWKDSEATGAGQWPPFTRGPRVISNRRLLALAATRTALLPLFPAALGELLFRSGIGFSIYLVCVGLLVKTESSKSNLLWRAYLDRRKLWRVS